MNRLRSIIPILLFLTSCAHCTPHALPTEGYWGRIHPGKPVYCALTSNMKYELCGEVQSAVRAINKAVGKELLHYAGIKPINSMGDVPPKTVDNVLIGEDALPANTLGMTGPRAVTADGYILQTIVIISPSAFEPPYAVSDVILHELLHVCGLGHAEQDSLFPTIIAPHAQPHLHGLQPGDIEVLRIAYAR